jgi:hypothetical protein
MAEKSVSADLGNFFAAIAKKPASMIDTGKVGGLESRIFLFQVYCLGLPQSSTKLFSADPVRPASYFSAAVLSDQDGAPPL